jgi:hypothetical protein
MHALKWPFHDLDVAELGICGDIVHGGWYGTDSERHDM